jgi:hypothetical protein
MALSGSNPKNDSPVVSMDVLSLLRLLARHWRVTAPALLLTLVCVVAALKVSAPTYHATGSIVLLNPREVPDIGDQPVPPEVGQNPYARYGDIAIVTDILTRIMSSDSKRDELASQGVPGYDIVANSFQRDPVFEVTGQGPDPDSAMGSTDIVLTEAGVVLTQLQENQGADPDYLISSDRLEDPSTATAKYGSTVRAVIGAMAVGGLGTLGLAVLAEFLGQRRAARRATSEPVAVGSDGAGDGSGGSWSSGSTVGGSTGSTDSREGVGAAGSNGSGVRGALDADAADEVETAGSNGSGVRGAVDADAADGVDTAGSNGSPERGSAAPRGAGRGLGVTGSAGSFDSAGIVSDGAPPAAESGGSSGSPTWGRRPAPLGRRPHRRPSLPDASNGSQADDHRDRPSPDR